MGRNMKTSSYWLVAGISTIGISHEKAGVECQDVWAYSQSVEPTGSMAMTAACVSDGAGSVSKASGGANLTAFAVSNWLSENFQSALQLSKEQIGRSCMARLRRLIRRAARSAASVPAEYAATLVAVCVGSDGAWLALHLGDGGIIGRFGNEVLAVSQPDKGEYANETWFVTSPGVLEHLKIYGSPFDPEPRTPTGFVVFSDGAKRSLVDRRTGAVGPAASIMLNWLKEYPLEKVSKTLDQNTKTVFREQSCDDCTIVLMGQSPEHNGT